MANMVFIDSNIWLYRFLIDPKSDEKSYSHKRRIAIQLTNSINSNIIISTQVITETCSVLKRKANFSDNQLLQIIEEFEEQCQVMPLTILEIKQACKLRTNYHLSFFRFLKMDGGQNQQLTQIGDRLLPMLMNGQVSIK